MTISPQELEILHAYLDNELSAAERTAFAARVTKDATLAALVSTEQRFRAELRTRVTRTRAPATLQTKVRVALLPTPAPSWWQRCWAWLSMPQPIRPLVGLAYTLLWVFVLGGVVWWSGRPAAETTDTLDALFQSHELYFEHQPALDVTGNAAQIRTWFDQKVPYTVDSPTLSAGWRLLGARLDALQQQPTAHILYMRGNGQRTSLSIFPSQVFVFPTGAAVRFADQEFWLRDNGVHRAILWHTDKRTYVLIGDIEVPATDLLQLAVEARTQLP